MPKDILNTLAESAKEKEIHEGEEPKKNARVAPKNKKEKVVQSEEALERERIRVQKEQENHPTRCWFDAFFCTQIKRNLKNRYNQQIQPAVFGIQLEAKRPNLQKTFIEPRLFI